MFEYHEKLSHLSEEKIYELIRDYYETEITVKELIKKYEIPIKGNNIVGLLPPEVTGDTCPCCRELMLKQRVSRNPTSYNQKHPLVYCSSCKHEGLDLFSKYCPCMKCTTTRERLQRELSDQRHHLLEGLYYSLHSKAPRSLDSLSMLDRVYLAALMRSAWTAKDGKIHPKLINEYGSKVSSTDDKGFEILTALYESGIIVVSDMPNEDAAVFEYEGETPTKVTSWYPLRVTYKLNLIDIDGPAQEVSLSYLPDGFLGQSEDFEQAFQLWLQIGQEECLAYLEERCDKLNIDFDDSDKAKSHIAKALEWFSVGQVRNIIWMATKDALAYSRENNIPRYVAKHLPAKFVLNKAERAQANGWELKPYCQPQDRSTLIEVISNQLLGIGDKWETELISEEFLRKSIIDH